MNDDEHTPNPGPSLWIGGGIMAGIGAGSFLGIEGWDTGTRLLATGVALLAIVFISIGVAQLLSGKRRR